MHLMLKQMALLILKESFFLTRIPDVIHSNIITFILCQITIYIKYWLKAIFQCNLNSNNNNNNNNKNDNNNIYNNNTINLCFSSPTSIIVHSLSGIISQNCPTLLAMSHTPIVDQCLKYKLFKFQKIWL